MTTLTILIRILISTVLSAIVGSEREVHGCAAGLRTHILVCVGSTLFMITSIFVAREYGGNADPSRIAAGVVTGIGFLGAGAIMRYGPSIRGLTTAASIWAVSAIGLAVGAGMYEAAVITTVVAVSVLVLSVLEERMSLKRNIKKLRIKLNKDFELREEDVKKIIEVYGGTIKRVYYKDDKGEKKVYLVFDVMIARWYHKDISTEVLSLPGVENAYWK